ncbi:MAG TPA: redoxin domain-containing protein [Pirellulales bacterium]|nr:redoxin domain-containing protein [Pirellulales bacterium]
MRRLLHYLLLLAAACWLPRMSAAEEAKQADPPAILAGHSVHGEVFNEGPRQRAYLMGTTGNVTIKVTTKSDEAQKFVNQGLGQLHGFWYFEAERSFRQAAALDPDCAMAYWGMAMANRENTKRGRGFLAEAVKRKSSVSPREAAWIDALDQYLGQPSDNKPRDEKERRRQYVRALEAIVHDHPDEIEAKAMLALMIWENSSHGIPLSSHEAVASLLREVHAANPMHPAHHYVIHLWDGEKPVRALPSAAQCGQAAPGIAHMWHMPGHTYTRVQRYADAVWQQEASARVDHAHMMRDRVMPDQIHNYAHNNDWLVENLSFIGRVRDGIELAKNLVELPRHPKYNTLGGSGSSKLGRHRLLTLLPQFEMWDELVQLSRTPLLDATDIEDEQVRFHRVVGAAQIVTGDLTQGKTHIAALQELDGKIKAERDKAAADAETKAKNDKKPDDQVAKARTDASGAFNQRLESVASALDELHGRWALAGNDVTSGLAHFEKAKGLSKEILSRVYLQAGNQAKAEQLAREAANEGKNRVLPLANLVEVLHKCGKVPEATAEFRNLQAISGAIDQASPLFRRLDELAPQLGLPAEWRQPQTPANDVGQRPDLATLGPFRWRPSPASEWTLPDSQGRNVSLSDYRGRPVIVIFYLGFGCLHCVEQLTKFGPMQPDFAAAGIDMLAVSSDSVEALRGSIESRAASGAAPLPVMLLSNADHSVFKDYRAFDDFENQPLHATFLIDKDGLVRWQDIGYEPFTQPKFLLDEAKRLLNLTP